MSCYTIVATCNGVDHDWYAWFEIEFRHVALKYDDALESVPEAS